MNKEKRTIHLYKIMDSAYFLKFNNPYIMCSSLMRIQEHYESPKFSGKVFSVEEYMDYYSDKFGNFTYFTDIGGFNFPYYSMDAFYDGKFSPLMVKEKLILEIFRDIEPPFYVIAACCKSVSLESDFNHEVAHALYYLDEEYKSKINKLLKSYDISKITEYLIEADYSRKHFKDEAQALLVERYNHFRRIGAKASEYKGLRREFRAVFNEHCKISMSKVGSFVIGEN